MRARALVCPKGHIKQGWNLRIDSQGNYQCAICCHKKNGYHIWYGDVCRVCSKVKNGSNTAYLNNFYSKFNDGDGCWLWKAGKTTAGYGSFRFHGVSWGAHVLSWYFMYGELPIGFGLENGGVVFDHKCNIPACVNPLHLEPVSIAENCKRGKDRMRML